MCQALHNALCMEKAFNAYNNATRGCYPWPHFTDDEAEEQSHLSKITSLVSGTVHITSYNSTKTK